MAEKKHLEPEEWVLVVLMLALIGLIIEGIKLTIQFMFSSLNTFVLTVGIFIFLIMIGFWFRIKKIRQRKKKSSFDVYTPPVESLEETIEMLWSFAPPPPEIHKIESKISSSFVFYEPPSEDLPKTVQPSSPVQITEIQNIESRIQDTINYWESFPYDIQKTIQSIDGYRLFGGLVVDEAYDPGHSASKPIIDVGQPTIRFPEHPNKSSDTEQHIFNENGVCIVCGCSDRFVEHFRPKCKGERHVNKESVKNLDLDIGQPTIRFPEHSDLVHEIRHAGRPQVWRKKRNKSKSDEWRTCSLCGGDGGPTGNCPRCDGSGFESGKW